MKEHKNLRLVRILATLALFAMLISSVGCDYVFDLIPGLVTDGTTDESIESSTATTTEPLPDTTIGDITESPETTDEVTTEDITTAPETTDEIEKKQYVDPLTGLKGPVDQTKIRPVAIIFDNLSVAAPQSGISKMDIVIEMMVESGISRLIGITNDYIGEDGKGTQDVYGPIRSTRHYMVEMCQMFNALMVGAGGSPQGYEAIRNNAVDYLDNERDRYAGACFFRDVERLNSDGYEHSLMASGIGIQKLAQQNSYSLTQNTPLAFDFIAEDRTLYLPGGTATHAVIQYSVYQQVQFVYSKSTGTYYRYQHGAVPHLDAETGEQLNFKNVLIIFADTSPIPGDTEGRLDISTVGSGDGYYLSGGRYVPIKWSRASATSDFVIDGAGGGRIYLSRGKTFISVVNSSLKDSPSIELNYRIGN